MEAPDKDFELSMRLRNNHLKSRRKALGLSQAKLAKLIGIGQLSYGHLESLRTSPLRAQPNHDGETWKETAKKVAAYFGCKEEELWPGAVLAVTVPEIVAEVSAGELLPPEAATALLPSAAVSPEDAVQAAKAGVAVREALATLPEAEAQVLRLRFGIESDDGPMELGEVGRLVPKKNGEPKSRQRVRQIEARALRRLRHPDRAKLLRQFAEELPGRMPWKPPPPPTAKQQRARVVRQSASSLDIHIGSWAERHRRPGVLKIWRSARDLISVELMADSTLRGVRVDRMGSFELTSDVLVVAQWIEDHYPDVAQRVLQLATEQVFFVLLLDEEGLEVVRTGLPWNERGDEEEGELCATDSTS